MTCDIRKWRLTDAASLAENLNNKKVMDNLRDGLPYPYTERDAAEFIQSMLTADADKTFAFAVTLDDVAIGSIGVFRGVNVHRRTAEIGYYLGEPYWGRGYMTGAVKKACDYVFSHSDIVRIFADPYDYNIASQRVLEKAGFTFEGTLRQNAVKNGRILDMKMYAILKEVAK